MVRDIERMHTNTRLGKYLVSPLTKVIDDGWFACSVSIRSGTGSATTDRVLRLTRIFRDRCAAADYATREGLQWVRAGMSPLMSPALA